LCIAPIRVSLRSALALCAARNDLLLFGSELGLKIMPEPHLVLRERHSKGGGAISIICLALLS
jgi:hypothetical protein